MRKPSADGSVGKAGACATCGRFTLWRGRDGRCAKCASPALAKMTPGAADVVLVEPAVHRGREPRATTVRVLRGDSPYLTIRTCARCGRSVTGAALCRCAGQTAPRPDALDRAVAAADPRCGACGRSIYDLARWCEQEETDDV